MPSLHRLALAGSVVLVCALGSPSTVRATGKQVAVRALNLTVADLPAGFRQTGRYAWTYPPPGHTGTAAGGGRAGFDADEVQFTREARTGVSGVGASVFRYRTVGAAHAAYARAYDTHRKAQRWHLRTVVGVERAAYSESVWDGARTKVSDSVIFRRGVYVVVEDVSGGAGTFSPVEAEQLAHIIDNRIQRAG